MRKFLLLFIVLMTPLIGFSQTQKVDSLMEVISGLEGKTNALDERVLLNETDLGKLTKIKVSGYIQAEFRAYQNVKFVTYDPYSTFLIRRARIKFTYEALDGVKFVLQPDLSTGSLSLKDAYTVLSIPKLQGWALWAGQMNRPNYEVEYSSSQRETMERSRVIRSIYPGEREIGVKLEYQGVQTPLKFQMMMMNGNFTSSQAIDSDTKKDLMARIVYSVKLPGSGIGIDFGANGYYGGTRIKSNPFVSTVNPLIVDSVALGTYLDKHWLGGEMQIYADVLGGLSIKGEYIAGLNNYASLTALAGTIAQKLADPNRERNFSGYYIYLIKNVGSKNQFVAKYDFYDPNTKTSGETATVTELNYKTWTLAWQYYMNDNIRISVQYEMPKNETNVSTPDDFKDNTFTLRAQAKF